MDLSRFTISGNSDRLEEAVAANRRLIKIRWYYAAALVLVVAVILAAIGNFYAEAAEYLAIAAGVYTLNGMLLAATLWCKGSMFAQRLIMALQIGLDISIAVSTIIIQGGVDARTTLLFATPVIAAGMLFKNRGVYTVAIVAGLAYASSVLVYELSSTVTIDPSVLLVPVLTYPAILLIQAKLASYLTRANENEVRTTAHEEFLSMISHQLRHPTSVSSTILDVISSSEDKLSADMKHKIGMLKAENEDLIRTIDNLLTYAEQGAKLRAEELNLPSLVKTISKKASMAAMRSSDLTLKMSPQPILLMGDPQKLGLMLINIVDNAFRYSSEGDAIEVYVRAKDGKAVCQVVNHGKGADETQIESALKQPYDFRSRKSAIKPVSGLNLGLYIAQEIAHQHNGSVSINSDNEKTVATIELKGLSI